MQMEPKAENDAMDLNPFLLFIWGKRKIFFWVSVISILGSSVFTYFVKPEYETYAVIFPFLSSSIEKQVEDQEFGYDVHAERLVQLLESDEVKDSVTKKFNLIEHYGIDKENPKWEDKLREKYYRKIKFVKSKFKSVNIIVRDADPLKAAAIANEIVSLVNYVNAKIRRKNSESILAIVEKELKEKLETVSNLSDSLSSTRKNEKDKASGEMLEAISAGQTRISKLRDSLERLRIVANTFDINEKLDFISTSLLTAQSEFIRDSAHYAILESNITSENSALVRAEVNKMASKRKFEFLKESSNEIVKAQAKYDKLNSDLESELQSMDGFRSTLDKMSFLTSENLASYNLKGLENDYNWNLVQLNAIRQKYSRALSNYLDPAPAAASVTKAKPYFTVVSPSYIKNISIALFLSLFFTAVFLSLWDKIRQMRTIQPG